MDLEAARLELPRDVVEDLRHRMRLQRSVQDPSRLPRIADDEPVAAVPRATGKRDEHVDVKERLPGARRVARVDALDPRPAVELELTLLGGRNRQLARHRDELTLR